MQRTIADCTVVRHDASLAGCRLRWEFKHLGIAWLYCARDVSGITKVKSWWLRHDDDDDDLDSRALHKQQQDYSSVRNQGSTAYPDDPEVIGAGDVLCICVPCQCKRACRSRPDGSRTGWCRLLWTAVASA